MQEAITDPTEFNNQAIRSIVYEYQSDNLLVEETSITSSQSPVYFPSFLYDEIEKDCDVFLLDDDAFDSAFVPIENNVLGSLVANCTMISSMASSNTTGGTVQVTSPTLSSSSSSSKFGESRFDQSTFVSKTKRKQKNNVQVDLTDDTRTSFQRLNGRKCYVEIVNQFATSTTLKFKVFTKRSDGKGTKFDLSSLQLIGQVNVECKLEPYTTNYINMKVDEENSVLGLPHLKQNLPITRGHEVWIQIQDSNQFFNIYCQKGKQRCAFSVHNMISYSSSEQFSNTYEVKSLSKFNVGSIPPSNVTFTFKNLVCN